MKQRCGLSLLAVMLLAGSVVASGVSDSNFATRVVSYSGPFGTSPYYNNPIAVLGKPTTWMIGEYGQTWACSLVYPAFNYAPDGSNVILNLRAGANIVVGFDHNVAHDPGNPYGVDFIVFSRALFSGSGYVAADTNMANYYLLNPASDANKPLVISVAQEDINDPNKPDKWYTFDNGPDANDLFPTNAFAWPWDAAHKTGVEQNWLRPVDPNLKLSDFNGKSAAQAIALYKGSAGGTGFDLSKLASADYAALRADPQTGRKYIKYIRVTTASAYGGSVDGFADVMQCPPGDLNQDYRVDMKDFAIAAQQWPDMTLVRQVVDNWLECTWNCQ